jgi:hypothetical protein
MEQGSDNGGGGGCAEERGEVEDELALRSMFTAPLVCPVNKCKVGDVLDLFAPQVCLHVCQCVCVCVCVYLVVSVGMWLCFTVTSINKAFTTVALCITRGTQATENESKTHDTHINYTDMAHTDRHVIARAHTHTHRW